MDCPKTPDLEETRGAPHTSVAHPGTCEGHPTAPETIIPGLRRSAWQADRRERAATTTGFDAIQQKPTTVSRIPSPINDRLNQDSGDLE